MFAQNYTDQNFTNYLKPRDDKNASGQKTGFNYYPFGLKHTGYNNYPAENIYSNSYKYQYNGKEFQNELGLNWTSMDFRNYDASIGRYMNPDLLSELAPMHNPYRFGFNNPVYWADPTGLYEETKNGIKITDKDEIAAYQQLVADNPNASVNEIINMIEFDETGTFYLELDEVVVTQTSKAEANKADNTFGSWVKHTSSAKSGAKAGFNRAGGTWRATNGSYNGNKLSVKHYESSWNGGSKASIKTYNGKLIAKAVGKGSVAVTVVMGTVSIYDGVKADGGKFGKNASKATGETAGGIIGGLAGASEGAAIGAVIGSVIPGLGTGVGAVIGGIIGGISGGYGGSILGGAAAEEAYEHIEEH